MRRRHFLSLLAPLALAACADSSAVPGPGSADSLIPPEGTPELGEPSDEERARFAERSNAFGFDLYKKTAKPGRNVAMSPFSVATALTMTWAGAKGDTEAQMRKVLHLDGAREQLLAEAGKTSAWLQATDRPFKLRGANQLFGEKGTFKLEQPFLDKTRFAYGAPLELLDFKASAEDARSKINGWVAQKTEKRITDLIPKNGVDTDTRLVLVNAIYFLGDWQDPFEKERTMPAAFSTTKTTKIDVPTMNQTAHYKHAKQDGVQAIELPYKGGDMSMVIIVPDAVDGLGAVEKSLDAKKLDELVNSMKGAKVWASIPKFEIAPPASLSLGDHLKAMGMKSAFDSGKADFTLIANPPSPADRLFIGKVFHKGFVKVDEKGTEAAAATAVVMPRAGAAPSKPIEFKADRPFLFVIRDNASGLVLFMGRVVDPTSK
jgi:serine protease inhibitor